MKRIKAFFALGTVSLLLAANVAFAASATYMVKTSGSNLMLRSGAGSGYGIIARMPNGSKVTFIGQTGSWAKVNYNGTIGYASMSYLVKISNGVVSTGIKGDVNNDGVVNRADHDMFVKYMAHANPAGFDMNNADMNNDGNVNLTDLAKLVLKLGDEDEYVNVANGWYRISPLSATSRGLDVIYSDKDNGTNVILYDYNATDNQKFYVKKESDGYYSIKAGHCDMYLDAAGGSSANGTNIQLYQWNNTNAQRWRFVDAGSGSYYIESKLKEKLSFDCAGGRSSNNTNIQLWQRGNVVWNKWKLTKVTAPKPKIPVAPSGYTYPLGYKTEFIYSDSNNNYKNHDYMVGKDPVYAAHDGTAYYYQIIGNYNGRANTTVSYGNVVILVGNGIGSKYAHLDSFEGFGLKYDSRANKGSSTFKGIQGTPIFIGQKYVKAGDKLGIAGTTGNSSGNHLHFEFYLNTTYNYSTRQFPKNTRVEPNNYFNK